MSVSKRDDGGERVKSLLHALRMILAPGDLFHDAPESKAVGENSLGVSRAVVGVAYPRTLGELTRVVAAARAYQVPIYPVSQGKNVGYGDATPSGPGQLVVGLRYLNRIREFDEVNGEVVVEPGVTQGQLAAFLRERQARYWADVTGASPDASVLGNTLEAGFGHTPIGNHRQHVLDMEVVLSDGSVLRTGQMPLPGPDLSALFIQSNFGIVTAIRIPLLPIPEKCVTFMLSFDRDEDYLRGIVALRDLRRKGVLTSLVHSANATRALMTCSRFPDDMDPATVLTDDDCRRLYNERSALKITAWSAIGGLYGLKGEVSEKIRILKREMRGIARVRIFTERRLKWADRLINSSPLRKWKALDFARLSFSSLKALHGILRGQPSEAPSRNIGWRVADPARLGLIWLAPVIPAAPDDAARLLDRARSVYAKHGFEMAATLTMISHSRMTAVFNISFDKSDARDTARAHAAYAELSSSLSAAGYEPYRLGILNTAFRHEGAKQDVLMRLKSALDPANILAPGRYGLDLSHSSSPAQPACEASTEGAQAAGQQDK